MTDYSSRLVVLFEHPEWQQPLFRALDRRGLAYQAFDLKSAAFGADLDCNSLYFNQASPSAYTRGNTRAVPLALALLESLERDGARVINGSRVFRLELSKIAQVGLLRRLGVDHPRTWAFNDPQALPGDQAQRLFPGILKPNQGGSGARMHRVDSLEELKGLLELNPRLWEPDPLLLLQEYLPHDSYEKGIVRLEFLGGQLLYAMRVLSGDNFNLCPSEACNPVRFPEDSETNARQASFPQFIPFPEVPADAVETAKRIVSAAGLDIGAVEYLETPDGRRVYYDINANSNLRRPIGEAFGFDPFDRVVDFLSTQLAAGS